MTGRKHGDHEDLGFLDFENWRNFANDLQKATRPVDVPGPRDNYRTTFGPMGYMQPDGSILPGFAGNDGIILPVDEIMKRWDLATLLGVATDIPLEIIFGAKKTKRKGRKKLQKRTF